MSALRHARTASRRHLFRIAGLYKKIILPWRMIDGPASAEAVTKEIARTPYRRAPRTSIFGALQFAKPLFDASGFNGLRRVIDVSGDGVNNMGPPVTLMRDQVVDAGITINGLPIMMKRPYGYPLTQTSTSLRGLRHRRAGSFMIAIHERDQFRATTKLVRVAGRRRRAASCRWDDRGLLRDLPAARRSAVRAGHRRRAASFLAYVGHPRLQRRKKGTKVYLGPAEERVPAMTQPLKGQLPPTARDIRQALVQRFGEGLCRRQPSGLGELPHRRPPHRAPTDKPIEPAHCGCYAPRCRRPQSDLQQCDILIVDDPHAKQSAT